jgi:hypothetical protein
LILLAGLLAFAGCLRADFYMDDFSFILHSNGKEPAPRRYELPGIPAFKTGQATTEVQVVTATQIIPVCFFALSERLVSNPAEASWLYHLWNLLFHLGTAGFAWLAGRNVLALTGLLNTDRERSIAALTGAVLFACHPLCSEPVNYAKCLNSLTVGMFGMMAVAGASKWLKDGGRGAAALTIGGLAGATLSYFPGMALAVLWVAILALFRMRSPSIEGKAGAVNLNWLTKHMKLVVSLTIAATVVLVWNYGGVVRHQLEFWGDRYPSHIWTQGRLLWVYLAKCLVPVGLCSDHHVPWSTPGQDMGALAGLVAGALLTLSAFVVIIRRGPGILRGWALLVLLALLPLLMRFGYVNDEQMVEYRAYPAIPWVMLMVGVAIVAVAARFPRMHRFPLLTGAALAAVWIILSIQRTQVWSDRGDLARDALKQYPLNDRAMTQLQAVAIDSDNLQGVKELHFKILSLANSMADFNRRHPGRKLDAGRLSDSILRSYQWMIWATAYTHGSAKGLEWADKVIETLRNRMPEKFRLDRSSSGMIPAWPLLTARDAVAAHREEIDVRSKELAARAQQPGVQ